MKSQKSPLQKAERTYRLNPEKADGRALCKGSRGRINPSQIRISETISHLTGYEMRNISAASVSFKDLWSLHQ